MLCQNIGIKRKAQKKIEFNDLLKDCNIGLSTVMLKKYIINETCKFPNLKTKEDFVLWLNFLKDGYKIKGIKENLVCWRKTKDSLSSGTIQKLSDGFKVYYKFMNYNLFKSLYYLFLLSIKYIRK